MNSESKGNTGDGPRSLSTHCAWGLHPWLPINLHWQRLAGPGKKYFTVTIMQKYLM